jgi:hypothetical protein
MHEYRTDVDVQHVQCRCRILTLRNIVILILYIFSFNPVFSYYVNIILPNAHNLQHTTFIKSFPLLLLFINNLWFTMKN